MDQRKSGAALKDLEVRVTALEQKLPTLLTRDEFKTAISSLATKADLERFATKADLERFATKADLEQLRIETRAELQRMATKSDLAESHQRLQILFEALRDEIRVIAEAQAALAVKLDNFSAAVLAEFARVDQRLMRLEATRG
ncbi:MAG: hypothetical protein HYS05_19785 [Acidobacteria bacterium]|nr:hypothetical protein [Acidobacteriota bacterium]